MNKRNLITGGAGFLGYHLTEKLLSMGEEVICIDNFYTGSKKNVYQWLSNPNYEIIRHDVIEPIYLEVDNIWHLACPASPISYQSNPIKTSKTTFLGTYNLLDLANKVNAKFFMASTSEVYGDPEIKPQPESYRGNVNPIGIRSCYDEGKRMSESLCFDYHRMHEVDIRVARIFNAYGPYMSENDGRVVCNFIVQALRGDEITIYGSGSQTRSFCFVDDLINGFVSLMESNFTGPVNLGNPSEFTINELSDIIRDKINKNIKVKYKPLPEDDPIQRIPDIKLAKDKLGWEPKVKLNEGLDLTIDYFKKIMK